MPKQFQNAMYNTVQHLQGVFCFLDDISIVLKGLVRKCKEIVEEIMTKIDKKRFVR